MAEGQRMTAADVVAQVRDGRLEDFVRDAVALVARELMEAEISAQVGAEQGEVAPEARVTHRNGYRPRPWETRVGEIELLIPRTRQGSYFPSFLEPRRRSEQAIVAVVLEAYVNGVSTRKVDRLVEQLGIEGMTKDRVSAMCRAWTSRSSCSASARWRAPTRICGWTPSTSRSATSGRVVSKALVVAYAVHETGLREVIGLDIGEVESGSFWVEFLRSPEEARAVRGAAGDLRSARGPEERDRPGAGLPVAAVHRALRPRHARALPPRPARPGLRRAAGGVQRRGPRPGPRARRARPRAPRSRSPRRSAGSSRRPRRTSSPSTCCPSEHWTKLRSTNPLGARQQRDRPPL